MLVAHNGFTFDARILTREIILLNMWEFRSIVIGFADTLPLFKKKLPDRVKSKETFKQEGLVNDLLPVSLVRNSNAHNAVSDVKILVALIDKMQLSEREVIDSAKPVNYVIVADRQKWKAKTVEVTLRPLKNHGVSFCRHDNKVGKCRTNLNLFEGVFFSCNNQSSAC